VLVALTLIVAGLLAPLVGALADQVNRRIGMVAATTVVCCAATVAIPLASQGDLWLAAGLFAVAQVAYTLATAIYDSLLVVVARPRIMSRVSGFGWAVGLAGGIVGLCLAILVVHGVPPGIQPTLLGTVFMLSGLLMAAVGLPAIGMMHRLSGNALAGRLSAALGPLTFSAVVVATGGEQAAVLSLIVFLVLGGLVLSGVRTPAMGSTQV
jgi:MFS-type transporter involved in bile tolerance (Atg22 family)